MSIKVEKIASAKCPKCKSDQVMKIKKGIMCNGCRSITDLKSGESKKLDKNWHAPKGYIPKERDDF